MGQTDFHLMPDNCCILRAENENGLLLLTDANLRLIEFQVQHFTSIILMNDNQDLFIYYDMRQTRSVVCFLNTEGDHLLNTNNKGEAPHVKSLTLDRPGHINQDRGNPSVCCLGGWAVGKHVICKD